MQRCEEEATANTSSRHHRCLRATCQLVNARSTPICAAAPACSSSPPAPHLRKQTGQRLGLAAHIGVGQQRVAVALVQVGHRHDGRLQFETAEECRWQNESTAKLACAEMSNKNAAAATAGQARPPGSKASCMKAVYGRQGNSARAARQPHLAQRAAQAAHRLEHQRHQLVPAAGRQVTCR